MLDVKHIGCIVVGEWPDEMSFEELSHLFGRVPLPQKNRAPQQSCVTWVVEAITELQKRDLLPAFDTKQFLDWGLSYADDRMLGEGSARPAIATYVDQ